jgi:hypothetical protein
MTYPPDAAGDALAGLADARHAHETGLISAAGERQFLRFYADPQGHSWDVAGDPSPLLF